MPQTSNNKNPGKVFSILGAIFLPVGILSGVGGVFLFFVWLIVVVFSAGTQGVVNGMTGNEDAEIVIDNTLLYVALPVFFLGVALLITGIVFLVIGKKKKHNQVMNHIETLQRE